MENIHFKDMSDDWGTGKMKGYFNGAAYADLDNDGNLDLVINPLECTCSGFKKQCPKQKLYFHFF